MVAGHADRTATLTATTPSHCTTCNRMRSCKKITLKEGVATFELEACQHCATVSANGQAASSTNNGSDFAQQSITKGKQNFEVDSDSSSDGSTASNPTNASAFDVRNTGTLADAHNAQRDAALVLESLSSRSTTLSPTSYRACTRNDGEQVLAHTRGSSIGSAGTAYSADDESEIPNAKRSRTH